VLLVRDALGMTNDDSSMTSPSLGEFSTAAEDVDY